MSQGKLHRNHFRHNAGFNAKGRALICAEYGVPNTGRQYRKLRKAIQRAVRAAERERARELEATYTRRRKNAKQLS